MCSLHVLWVLAILTVCRMATQGFGRIYSEARGWAEIVGAMVNLDDSYEPRGPAPNESQPVRGKYERHRRLAPVADLGVTYASTYDAIQ